MRSHSPPTTRCAPPSFALRGCPRMCVCKSWSCISPAAMSPSVSFAASCGNKYRSKKGFAAAKLFLICLFPLANLMKNGTRKPRREDLEAQMRPVCGQRISFALHDIFCVDVPVAGIKNAPSKASYLWVHIKPVCSVSCSPGRPDNPKSRRNNLQVEWQPITEFRVRRVHSAGIQIRTGSTRSRCLQPRLL